MPCPYGSSVCPCNDGDACHYRPYGESVGWMPPEQFWTDVDCGCPPSPVAWIGDYFPLCHCRARLDVGRSTSYRLEYVGGVEWPLVECPGCGCLVAVPANGLKEWENA